jgi:hypothetical protein
LAGPDGTRKFVLATVGSCLMVMLHIIAIVAFVGIGAVCYMIGDENTTGGNRLRRVPSDAAQPCPAPGLAPPL